MLKANLIGNLGGDPELHTSPDERPFLRMNVACNFRARNQAGEWEDRTEWVRVTVFGQQAERLGQYLRKGTRVYVDGRLEARPWLDQQHEARAGLEVIANDVQFMSSRADDDRPRQPVAAGAPNGRGTAPVDDGGELEDLPF